MIYLSGAINLANQAELQREAELFARNGWELKDPTTHRVSVTIDEADIDSFCQYLRNRPRDRRVRSWTDRNGETHQAQTVTFFLNGTEMTGNWTRLRSRIDSDARRQLPQNAAAAVSNSQTRTAPPIRRSPSPQAQANGFTHSPSQPPTPPAATAPLWNPQPLEDDDAEIPF